MTLTPTALDGVLLIEPRLFPDERGHLVVTWKAAEYAAHGMVGPWTQDNVSQSKRGVIRALHLQLAPHAQGKLVSALSGTIYDVAVDVRPDSPTYGQHVGFELSGENGKQVWIPPGFAHGFSVLSEQAIVSYKCSGGEFMPDSARSIRWDDPALGIDWRVDEPLLNERDAEAPLLADVAFRLAESVR